MNNKRKMKKKKEKQQKKIFNYTQYSNKFVEFKYFK
jgi:hypothetical protein